MRETRVYCEIHPYDVGDEFVRDVRAARASSCRAATSRVTEGDTPRAPQAVFELGVPVLGICYGMQTMARAARRQGRAGHACASSATPRCARAATPRCSTDIEDSRNAEGHGMLKVWMSHGDKVTALPPGFKLMASTPSCPIAGMADEARGFYGVQFHPEVTHTLQGAAILDRFVHDICGCEPDWNMRDYVAEAVARDPRAGRQRGSDPRPVRRRRFVAWPRR